MSYLPITALAAWVRCPRSFYASYVLKVKPELNRAMALGLTKHKLFELWHAAEAKVVKGIDGAADVSELFNSQVIPLTQRAVRVQSRSLKKVDVLLTEAFKESLPIVKGLAKSSVERVLPLLDKGLRGEELWHAVSPKVKTEYSIKSEVLKVKGRIDVLECYDNKVVPVELKSGRTPDDGVFDHHRMQAGCYAVVLEELFGASVPKAAVHYIDTDERRDILMNPFLREKIIETARIAHRTLESGDLPSGCGKDYCDSCKICEERVLNPEVS